MKRLPIAASLPFEVLIIIVHAISPFPDVYTLVRLSQVCRRWRDVLSSYPSLWTKIRIPKQSIPLVTTMLTRSADYPLQVVLNHDHPSEMMFRYYDLVCAHIHHVESLCVTGSCIDIEGLNYIFSSLCDPPRMLPMLKHFHLTPPTYSQGIPRVPENLFHHTPELKELHLSRLSVSHQMPIFKTVTELCLREVAGITSFVQLMDILTAASANLQVLNLGHLIDLPRVSDSHRETNGRIRFPFLQSMSFTGLEPPTLMAVLNHITVPSDIEWSIACANALHTPELDITPLFSFLREARTGTHLVITISGDYMSNFMQISFKNNLAGPSSASLMMDWKESEDYVHRLLVLITNLKFCEVSCCDILISQVIPFQIDKEIIKSLFLGLCHLQKLSIVSRDSFTILSSQFSTNLRPTQTLVPCPLLNDLTLNWESPENHSNYLIQFLQERHKAGNVLTNLRVITKPNFTAKFRMELEKLAKNVLYT